MKAIGKALGFMMAFIGLGASMPRTTTNSKVITQSDVIPYKLNDKVALESIRKGRGGNPKRDSHKRLGERNQRQRRKWFRQVPQLSRKKSLKKYFH